MPSPGIVALASTTRRKKTVAQNPSLELRRVMFAYGTLLVPEIIARVIGRVPPSDVAELVGFRRFTVANEVFPAVFPDANCSVMGVRYLGVGTDDFERLDHYEGDLYQRVQSVVLVRGAQERADCYVLRPGHEHRLSNEPWELEHFLKLHARTYTWD
jgi:gamma-glutamylcyclotransferase (GGCT)/AIG2-like uncharacterized protein YtfP